MAENKEVKDPAEATTDKAVKEGLTFEEVILDLFVANKNVLEENTGAVATKMKREQILAEAEMLRESPSRKWTAVLELRKSEGVYEGKEVPEIDIQLLILLKGNVDCLRAILPNELG